MQITDTHLLADPTGRFDEVVTRNTLDSVIETMRTSRDWPPDLILATGDLAQQPVIKTYDNLLEIFQQLSVPVMCLPGNHDAPHFMHQILNLGNVTTHKQVSIGPWRILLLNSHVAGTHAGELANTELDWLSQQLDEYQQTPTLIALHHHPLSIHSPWMDSMILKNGDTLIELLHQHPHVKAVIFGHIHQEFLETHNNITYMGTPSSCVQFKPGVSQFTVDEKAPGFRLLQLHQNGTVTTQVERISA